MIIFVLARNRLHTQLLRHAGIKMPIAGPTECVEANDKKQLARMRPAKLPHGSFTRWQLQFFTMTYLLCCLQFFSITNAPLCCLQFLKVKILPCCLNLFKILHPIHAVPNCSEISTPISEEKIFVWHQNLSE